MVVALLAMLCILPARALTGPEAVAAAEAGSLDEVAFVFTSHSVDELFRVRQDGKGLLHILLPRGEGFWALALSAGWPVAEEKGWTPQHEAALLGLEGATRALLRAGARLDVKEPVNGGTPLQVAAFNGHLGVVKLLVQAGANVNARDNDGWTPLSQARDQGFPEVVEWLRTHGATR